MEPVEPVLKNTYQRNTYRKDLSWPDFDDKPRIQDKQQLKERQSCIFVFVVCLKIPSSNYRHKTRCDNEWTYLEKNKVEPVQPVLKNIYLRNTYRKDLSWSDFDNEPRVQEKQQVKEQQFCIFVFVVCLTIPSGNYRYKPRRDNSIPYMGIF